MGTSDLTVWGGENREVGTAPFLFAVSLWMPRVTSLSFIFLTLTWRYWGLCCAVVGSVTRRSWLNPDTAGLCRYRLLL